MASDPNIKIKIKTEGDTSGAEAVQKSIFAVEKEAKKAEKELDVLEAKKRLAARQSAEGNIAEKAQGLLGNSLVKGAAAKAGYAEELNLLTKLMGGLRTAASGVTAGILGVFAAVGAGVGIAATAIETRISLLKGFETEANRTSEITGKKLTAIDKALIAEGKAYQEIWKPVTDTITKVGEKWMRLKEIASSPIQWATGLLDLRKANDAAEAAAEKLKDTRRKMANDQQTLLTGLYDRELGKLKEQEDTVNRINTARNKLASIEQQRADNQVKIAQQDGGDVALAEANALAVTLKNGVAKLSGSLVAAKAALDPVEAQFNAAAAEYNNALQKGMDKFDPAQFNKLSEAYDQTQSALNAAKENFGTVKTEIGQESSLLAENTEIALRDLQDKNQNSTSKAAKAAFDGIENTLRDGLTPAVEKAQAEVTKTSEALKGIQVEAGAVTTAATAKKDEVKASLDTERTNTVATIQTLAPAPDNTQAIVSAVKAVEAAITAKDNATIAALAGLTATCNGLANQFSNQQTQINQLFSRIR